MNGLIIGLSYFLSGFFMKLSDDEYDEKSNKLLAIILGLLCGLFTALASFSNADAACIFIAILLGNIIAFKVDGTHHLATMAIFVVLLVILGFPAINFFALAICMIGAIIDEWGNDNKRIYSKSKFFEYFFDYRFTLKVFILILAICGVFNFWTFIFFICFELAYEFARIFFKKFLN